MEAVLSDGSDVAEAESEKSIVLIENPAVFLCRICMIPLADSGDCIGRVERDNLYLLKGVGGCTRRNIYRGCPSRMPFSWFSSQNSRALKGFDAVRCYLPGGGACCVCLVLGGAWWGVARLCISFSEYSHIVLPIRRLQCGQHRGRGWPHG